uniref:Beta-fructofuranosidase, cell wall isozyme n=1 Tax=Zea mays TaxID=4577 RepID=INVA_MAIZE|nr:RecName: Full=Beta-fructofuranosidase, cell wall isozyme; AltName: Full=Invertase; AltName: Full=Sucrose hydrolase; Flags: Precursor [Zea mays]AAA64487.1 invertase [Zea mays]prf//2118364A cell wall invertase [Zea mays]
MGTRPRGVVLAPWAVVLVLVLALRLAGASHVIHRSLEAEAAPSVPASIVSPLLRTGYHFQPPMNWINDPNAPLYYKGWYHLFYQYNPKGAVWGNIVWAHSVSRDLINWVALEPAIYPSIPSDKYGCWSGSATILEDGTPAILYTGIDRADINYQVQVLALPKDASDPLLREWEKPEEYNPVATPAAGGINATQFRDPTTAWRHAGHWRMLVGSVRGARGMALVYRSRDFRKWTKAKHPLHSAALTGMWECPDFFPVSGPGLQAGLDTSAPGTKYVLKSSLDLTRYDYYTIGSYDGGKDRYYPDDPAGDYHHRRRYDYGNYYASKTFYDPVERRRVLLGWANESDSVPDDKAKGWAGIHAIPRKIWLDPTGKQLLQWPIHEVEKLRGKAVSVDAKLVKPGDHFEVTGIATYQADVEVSFELELEAGTSLLEKAEAFDPAYDDDAQKLCGVKGADARGGVGPFGLWVLASADLQERTAVFFRVFRDGHGKPKVLMCTDPTKSSLSPDLYKPTFAGFVDADISSGKITLRSLIDRSVVESFGAGGKTCILSRVYPSIAVGKDAHLYVFNNGEVDVTVSGLTAWEMKKPLMNGA